MAGIDHIQPLLFAIWDESQSPYFNDNIANSSNPNVDLVSLKGHSRCSACAGPDYACFMTPAHARMLKLAATLPLNFSLSPCAYIGFNRSHPSSWHNHP